MAHGSGKPGRVVGPGSWPAGLSLTGARRQALLIAGAILVHLGHQWLFRDWFIEDAAICFAYARNIVDGEGIVPWPGGERIEGYSNPLWMLLLVGWQAVGVDGWAASKLMAAVFGSAALPLAWLLAREALPDEDAPAAVLAPILLAGSAHHAIWAASGLENSLFSALLLLGAWMAVREDRRGARFPGSAVVFCLLALTRPEGVLYAAIAGFWVLVWALQRGRGLRPVFAWVATFWLPYLLFVLWRVWYFAWPLPITYYAKLGVDTDPLTRWYSRGWGQLREYAQRTWTGWWWPVFPLALLGRSGWRGRAAVGVALIVGMALLWPGPVGLRETWFWPDLPEPRAWLVARIGLIGLVAFALPLLAMGRPGWRARALCWHLAVCGAFFSVYSDGDWMHGLRWMSLFAPLQAVLMAVGAHEVLALLPRIAGVAPVRRWGTAEWLVASFAVGMWFAPNATFTRWYLDHTDFDPGMIKRRVEHVERLVRRLHLEEPVRTLDMDMGAHLWWSRQRMVDMAGLVDVPMALHNYRQRDFIQEYVFDEQRPHFAHVHLAWSSHANFKSYPDWPTTFFPFQGYPDGRIFHGGQFARRDLVMSPWPHPERRVDFQGGLRLHGFHVPAREVGRGRALYVEIGLSTADRRDRDFTVVVFLADSTGRITSWDLPVGYGIYPVAWWEPGEVFHGRYAVSVPASLPEGTYDLGFLVLDGDTVAAALEGSEAGAILDGPRFAEGEVRFPGAITVVSAHALDKLAEADRQAALEHAAAGRCDEAERAWFVARKRVARNYAWARDHRPEVGRALSRCYVDAATRHPEDRIALLERAHTWDHRLPPYVQASEAVADELFAQGKQARAAGDHDAAYRLFSDVLRITPYYAWARRYAEEARDHRLGLYEEQPWDRTFGPW